jgi:hypothetical protein
LIGGHKKQFQVSSFKFQVRIAMTIKIKFLFHARTVILHSCRWCGF